MVKEKAGGSVVCAVRVGMGGKVRDMATGCMYRKVGIGMGGYVLYTTVPRHGPGVGMGK